MPAVKKIEGTITKFGDEHDFTVNEGIVHGGAIDTDGLKDKGADDHRDHDGSQDR